MDTDGFKSQEVDRVPRGHPSTNLATVRISIIDRAIQLVVVDDEYVMGIVCDMCVDCKREVYLYPPDDTLTEEIVRTVSRDCPKCITMLSLRASFELKVVRSSGQARMDLARPKTITDG